MITQEGRARSIDQLWSVYAERPDSELRAQIIEQCKPLALAVVNYMGHRGDEDLQQVALLGLVRAVDRFDPGTGNRFSTFAVPTILGEIKRYLRDHSRLVRPPRTLHDLNAAVQAREREMTATLGRAPTLTEVAGSLGVGLEQVVEAMAMEDACVPCSIHGLLSSPGFDTPMALEECLGGADPELAHAEDRIVWKQLLQVLAEPFRQVIELRYFEGMTQKEVAERLGVSQMQVSRLERRALARLRAQAAP